MHRDNSNRSFFFIQATEFITAYNDTLPEHTPTSEEVDSGLSGISEDFGFAATLFTESERMSIDYEIFLERDVMTFYHLTRLHAWQAKATNEYSKLMAAKGKQ